LKSPKLRFVAALLKHRELWWRLTERAVASRYKGSALGFGWSLLQPLVMLAVYTFVFSTIFKSRWTGAEEAGSLGYAVNLFAGLIVFNLFADCIGASPGLILSNKNYVTKVIFPLELLGATTVSSATFQAITSALILVAFELFALHTLPITLMWLPLVWMPLLLGCLALSWVISALGVYLRDLEQLVPMLLSVMMFLSAVFYPISSLPTHIQPLMHFNPLAMVIEQTRRVGVEGLSPSRMYLVLGCAVSAAACEIAYRGFERARRGFADVL
jgi:lipopolysaccharide transport system permease protein